MKSGWVAIAVWVVAGMLMVGGCAAERGVTGARAAGEAVIEDVIRLENGAVRVEVSPELGRITHMGWMGGENLLWMNAVGRAEGEAYFNAGGDKIWPLAQSLWARAFERRSGWPPDGVIDGRPWAVVARGERSVTMESAVNPQLGARVRREITLDETAARVTIRNRIEQERAGFFPLQVWSVTQVKRPRFMLLEMVAHPTAGREWVKFSEESIGPERAAVLPGGGALRFETRVEPAKVGTLGRWIAGVWDEVVFYQATALDVEGMYPERSSVQGYSDGTYAELEVVGPARHLRPGESLETVVRWWLVRREGMDAAAIAEMGRELAERQAAISVSDQELEARIGSMEGR